MKKPLIAILLLALPVWVSAADSGSDEPLLMPGKQSLYQRILSIPGAKLANQAGGSQEKNVLPFTAFYVYNRSQENGSDWLQIGTDRHGDIAGWLPANDTLEWSQGLTVAFRDPTNHDRSLLFRDRESLQKLATSQDPEHYQQLYMEAVSNSLSSDSPVVAIQPPVHIDIQEDFYLVPIQQHEDIFIGSEQARMLRVASVPLANSTQDDEPVTAVATGDNAYSAGLVFAIDSTLSMGPYITRTREAVLKIYDSLGDAGLLGNVNFGLVAFRDNPAAAPELDYLTRTYVTLEEGRNPGTFLDRINGLSAASNSSQDFVEDAYAGLKQAIDKMDWQGHAARYVVLVTDAGARDQDDPLSTTGMNARQLQALAQEKGIAIFVLHLLTPATMANHEADAKQYQELSHFPGIGSLYYGVPTGDVNEFGLVLDTLAAQITQQVQQAGNLQPAAAPSIASDNPQLAELQTKVSKLGHALRMQYLQKTASGKPPKVFNAWLLDSDMRNPERKTLDVRVLLTRDQLSDLHDILRQVLATAEEGLLSPQNFLDELKSLAATASRTPEELGRTTATTAGAGNSLADLGFMREYIEGLPYTGEVMNLSLDDWQSWPAREQIAFLNRLEEKIRYYRALHDHTDLWISLDGGPVDGDSVFPIALSLLP